MKGDADHLGWYPKNLLGKSGACRRGAAVRAWVHVVRAVRWADPPAVKRMFNSADILRDGRVVFDIGGHKYRLVAWVNDAYGVVYVRFIGTHRAYDRIDAQSV